MSYGPSTLSSYGSKNNDPSDGQVLMPEGLHGKGDLGNMTKLPILKGGGYIGLPKWIQKNHRVLIIGRQKVQSQRENEMMVGVMWGYKPKNAQRL